MKTGEPRQARRRRIPGTAALVFLVAFALTAWSGGAASAHPNSSASPSSRTAKPPLSAGPNQSITVATTSEPLSLDPQRYNEPGTNSLIWNIYDALYEFIGPKLTPSLAKGFPKRVNDTTWEVNLKRGVVFSNGKKFTADDVVYSINRIIVPAYASRVTDFVGISGATKVNPYKVRIKTAAPDPLLPQRLTSIKIIVNGTTTFNKAIGTGPYKLTFYDRRTGILRLNPRYRGERPQVTKVTVKIIPDPATRLAALRSGEVDMIPGISPDVFGQVPKVVATKADVWTVSVRLNAQSPPLDDVRVRQAINYAVNKTALTNAFFKGGYAHPTPCQMAPSTVESSTKVLKPYPYEPSKAKQLVAQAGATGKTVDLVWVAGFAPLDREVGQYVAQQITQNTGLKVNLQLVDFATYVAALRKLGPSGPQMTIQVASNALNTIARLTSLMYPSTGGSNDFKDATMDKLFATANSSFPPARQAAWEKVLKYGCDKAVMLFLYSYKEMYGVSKRINFEYADVNLRPAYHRILISKTK